MDEATLSLFGSLLCPYWMESEAQLTEKQAVLLMHDIYVVRRRDRLAPHQPLSVCALLPAPREEQASTASWKPQPPFEAAEMD